MIVQVGLVVLGLVVGTGIGLMLGRSPPEPARKQIQRRMSVQDAALTMDDVFLALLSHQFRTPLNNIIGYSELLQEDAVFLEQNDFVPDLVKIRRSGEHLSTLLDDVIELSRIASGRMAPNLEDVDVAILLNELQRELEPMLVRTLARLETVIAEDAQSLRTDRDKLSRALENLIRQIVAFTAQGTLRLAVTRDGENVVFTLCQDALVLTREQVEILMLDFQAVAETAVDETHGAGLGLVVTREFARVLGGKLAIDPRDDGVDFALTVRG